MVSAFCMDLFSVDHYPKIEKGHKGHWNRIPGTIKSASPFPSVCYYHLERGKPMIFHVTLEKAEDGWIVAECPALPGCVSQGKDEEEALKNIKEAITAWLWAEDQKAISTREIGKSQHIVVAV
jgi:predicted RNase H-like HicB family nuclease